MYILQKFQWKIFLNLLSFVILKIKQHFFLTYVINDIKNIKLEMSINISYLIFFLTHTKNKYFSNTHHLERFYSFKHNLIANFHKTQSNEYLRATYLAPSIALIFQYWLISLKRQKGIVKHELNWSIQFLTESGMTVSQISDVLLILNGIESNIYVIQKPGTYSLL